MRIVFATLLGVLTAFSAAPASGKTYEHHYRNYHEAEDDAPRAGTSLGIGLLPFGAGFFDEGRYGLGLASATIQTGALYTWYVFNREADRLVDETNDFVGQRRGLADDGAIDPESAAFVDQRRRYVDRSRKMAQQALLIFTGTWIASATWSLLDDEEQPRPVSRRATKRPSKPEARRALTGWRAGAAVVEAPGLRAESVLGFGLGLQF